MRFEAKVKYRANNGAKYRRKGAVKIQEIRKQPTKGVHDSRRECVGNESGAMPFPHGGMLSSHRAAGFNKCMHLSLGDQTGRIAGKRRW